MALFGVARRLGGGGTSAMATTGAASPATPSTLLLEAMAGRLLLQDGVSFLLLEPGQ